MPTRPAQRAETISIAQDLKMRFSTITAAATAGILLLSGSAFSQTPDPENTLIMQLQKGKVTIALRPDLAPKHVERLKTLTRKGFYDGIVFHRVIPGFMAQTGDPTGTGTGGSDLPDLKAEFSDTSFTRGVVGMARSSDPNSANSQFFITYADAPWLNGQYTVVGQVTEGMEAVDAIKKGTEANNGQVENPDRIVSIKVAADAK
jgi:peptidylprolyl isomerase